MTSGNEKGRRFFGWSKPTKRHQNICNLFSAMMPLFSREKSSLKGRWWRKAVAIRICPSSNHVSCSESAIKIYGSKEEIRLQKSPETVDAPGFAPDASIPVTLYGAAGQIRTADLILTNHRRAFQPLLYKALRRFFIQKGRGRSLFVPLFPSAHFPVWVTVWVKRTPPRQRSRGWAAPSHFVSPRLAHN